MNEITPITPVRPGRGPLAQSVDRLRQAAVLRSRSRPCGAGGIVGVDAAGATLAMKPRPSTFMARVSGGGPYYTFAEVYGSADPSGPPWVDYPNGRDTNYAYELNGKPVPNNAVVELHPVAGGAWYWFAWKSKVNPNTGGSTYITLPYCSCQVPSMVKMTSADPTCNDRMFQTCTIAYGPPPASLAALNLAPNVFLSTAEFFDPVSASSFYYYLFCQYNGFYLTRVYPTSPYGSPYQDAVLYTWFIGGAGNTCLGTPALQYQTAFQGPFRLDGGIPFSGSDASCNVKIDQT